MTAKLIPTTNTYFIWADLVRIVAIGLVVMAHCINLGLFPSFDSNSNLFLFVLARNGVPLFVMLSGALLLPKNENLKVFFHKRLKRIVIPWLLATSLFVALETSLADKSFFEILVTFKNTMTAEFTFVPMIFCLYLLMPIFRKIAHNSDLNLILYVVVLWFAGLSLLPHARNSLAFPLYVDNGLVRQTIEYSGYLFLGFAIIKIFDDKKIKTVNNSEFWLALFLISMIASMWLLARYENIKLEYVSYTAPFIVLSSVSLFTLLWKAGSNLKASPLLIKNWLTPLSKTSFGVFLIHPLIIRHGWPLIEQNVVVTVSSLFAVSLIKTFFVILISYLLVLGVDDLSRFKIKNLL